MSETTSSPSDNRRQSRRGLYGVCLAYLFMGAIFGSMNLDIDEFGFVREPYELLGGDYTIGYLQQHKYSQAVGTLLKSYYFYWKYRPLFSPIVSPKDQQLFEQQEREFGYTKPESAPKEDAGSLSKYKKRLIVPEPDRFYSHGAGKPLLAALASIPQSALVRAATSADKGLLYYQYNYNYHPVFILVRLVQMAAGLATILIVYWILIAETDRQKALLGAAVVAFFPTCIRFFPNIHHDPLQVPFLVLSAYSYYKRRFKSAGLYFGLALAVKNTAIILIPVFLIYSLASAWHAGDSSASNQRARRLRLEATAWITTMLLGLLVLLPFADPVSYVSEILTPITHRQHDLRGENVEHFTLSDRLNGSDDGSPAISPAVQLVRILLRLEDNGFFFLVIGVLLFWSQRQHPLARMAFMVLLLALPFALEFGSDLNYRSLLFVPFFALCCAFIAPRRYLLGLVVLLLVVDAVYCIDPITADTTHNRVSKQTFWPAVVGSLTP